VLRLQQGKEREAKGKGKADTEKPLAPFETSGFSLNLVAGTGFEPVTFGL
jgi:hypothetical protein